MIDAVRLNKAKAALRSAQGEDLTDAVLAVLDVFEQQTIALHIRPTLRSRGLSDAQIAALADGEVPEAPKARKVAKKTVAKKTPAKKKAAKKKSISKRRPR